MSIGTASLLVVLEVVLWVILGGRVLPSQTKQLLDIVVLDCVPFGILFVPVLSWLWLWNLIVLLSRVNPIRLLLDFVNTLALFQTAVLELRGRHLSLLMTLDLHHLFYRFLILPLTLILRGIHNGLSLLYCVLLIDIDFLPKWALWGFLSL